MNCQRTSAALLLAVTSLAIGPVAVAQDEEPIEEIVAVGIRASMAASAELKRTDDRIVDAVVAEDIGKLPDNNVAEALQRVTGVAINRDFGVGSEVSIRGLPQNRVELNGRSTLGDGRNGVDFQDFPSSFLSAVEVIKSPTPEMIEGALGGTISLVTSRPLDLNERVFAVDAQAEYADKTENWAPVINANYGDNWDLGGGGTFGVQGMISYQDRTLRQDTYQSSLFVYDDIPIVDGNDVQTGTLGPAANTPSGKYVVPVEPKIEPWVEDRERTAYNLMLQWAPASGRGSFYADLNSTERTGGQEAYSILSVGGFPVATADSYEDANGALNNYRLLNHFAIPKTWSTFRDTKSYTYALGGDWSFTDRLTLSGEYSTAESDTSNPASEFNWRAHDSAAEAIDPSGSNELITPVTIVNGSSSVPSVIYDDGEIYSQIDNYVLREFRHRERDTLNQEDAFRLDLEYTEPFGVGWISSIKGGIRGTNRDYEYNEASFRVKDIHKDMYDALGNPTVVPMSTIINMFPGTVITPGVNSNLFDHAGYVGPNQLSPFTVYDGQLLQDPNLAYAMVQQLLLGSNFNDPNNSDGYISPTGTLAENMTPTLSAFSGIGEDTSAAYLQFNLDFDNVRIVLGGRYVKTEITSTAWNQEGTELVSDKKDYDDFLPSINTTIELTDDTLMRFSAARVMRRADFNELSPTYEYNSDFILASRGNPGLDPYRANQFDLAFEHYFGDDSDMLSFTMFYKDVASFLTGVNYCAYEPEAIAQQNTAGIYDNTCLRPPGVLDHSFIYTFADSQAEFDQAVADNRNGILTTSVTNGSSGKVQGFELGWMQTFDSLPGPWSGLGINANYTFADSETPDGTPMLDISENSYNAQVFWEYGDFGIRLAYTYRDRFLDETGQKRVDRVGQNVDYPLQTDPTRGNDYRDDLSQLDLSGNWDVTDNISVYGFVYNITGEPLVNQSVTGTTWQIRESDTRYTLGVRAKF